MKARGIVASTLLNLREEKIAADEQTTDDVEVAIEEKRFNLCGALLKCRDGGVVSESSDDEAGPRYKIFSETLSVRVLVGVLLLVRVVVQFVIL